MLDFDLKICSGQVCPTVVPAKAKADILRAPGFNPIPISSLILCMLLCPKDPWNSFNWFSKVGRQLELIAYFSNIYTVSVILYAQKDFNVIWKPQMTFAFYMAFSF